MAVDRVVKLAQRVCAQRDAMPYCLTYNDQYRICFVWNDGDADDVEIVDYH
jgi:proteic killer suppression protein